MNDTRCRPIDTARSHAQGMISTAVGLGVAVPLVLFLLCFAGIGYKLYKRRPTGSIPAPGIIDDQIHPFLPEGEPRVIGKPLVLIINSYDCKEHEDCVIALVQFLNVHAGCDARHHCIGIEANADQFTWMIQQMSQAKV